LYSAILYIHIALDALNRPANNIVITDKNRPSPHRS